MCEHSLRRKIKSPAFKAWVSMEAASLCVLFIMVSPCLLSAEPLSVSDKAPSAKSETTAETKTKVPLPKTTAETTPETQVAPPAAYKHIKIPAPEKAPDTLGFLTKSMVSTSIPEISKWEQNMSSYGLKHFTQVMRGVGDETGVWYYDGIKVYYQIAAYTGDDKWLEGVKSNLKTYRDSGVMPARGRIGGWRLFPHGLKMDYLKTGDTKSREAIILLAKNGAFANMRAERAKMANVALSRETAYNINCWQTARELDEPGFGEDAFIDVALGHLKTWSDWLKNPSQKFPTSFSDSTGYQPFMFALTCEALIRHAESKFAGSSRRQQIVESIKETAELTFKAAYQPQSEALWYESNKKVAAPDLGLLICPLYGWLWHRTGDGKFRDMGDKLFAGGVKGAFLNGGKQFSQNYRWSFDFVKWRSITPDPSFSGGGAKAEKPADSLKYCVVFPNPFRLSGSLKFTVEKIFPKCTLAILNSAGEKVIVLNSGKKDYLEWDGKNEKKEPVPEGSYSYLIQTKEGAEKKGAFEIKK
ncbi:MAG: gliding motility-associated C-terminal domain-containing protein [Candidatus Firestonebacteria bacterium]